MANEQLIDQIYAAFASGDFDGFRALLSDDMVATINGTLPHSGRYESADAFMDAPRTVGQNWPNFSLTPTSKFASGAHVFVQCDATADGLHAEFLHMWKVENGKVVEFYAYDDSQKMAASMK